MFYEAWRDSLTNYQSMMSAVKAFHLIVNDRHNSRLLFDTVTKLTQHHQEVNNTDLSAHDF